MSKITATYIPKSVLIYAKKHYYTKKRFFWLKNRTLLRVLKVTAAMATRTQDQTLLCVLKAVSTATTQAMGTALC